MHIGNFNLEEQVLVIAEIGNNHEGDSELAEELIRLAARSGADAVKFQTYRTEHYVSPQQTERFSRLKHFELSFDTFSRLSDVACDAGVLFLSTPFDLESASFLNRLVPAFKISSGDNTFYPLLTHVAAFRKPVLLSCGMLSIENVRRSIKVIENTGSPDGYAPEIAALHCVTEYPVPDEHANLAAIETMRREIDATIGYSDHTTGITAASVAVAAGARIIEKHFTIRKNYSDFRDHQLSADPDEFSEMIHNIRRVEKLMGDGVKTQSPAEKDTESAVRRSIAAARTLSANHILGMTDLTWVRPGTGIPPGEENKMLGRRLLCSVQQGELLMPNMTSNP